MRQIFPASAAGEPAPALGPADPLGSVERIRPSVAGGPGVTELIDALAAIYAYPDRLWVRANMIASVDGAVALDGRSGGLSGPADRLLFSVLRSLADVVLVGAGTARAERYRQAQPDELWPQLRAGRPAAPPIAVITGRLDLDLDGPLFGGGAHKDARTGATTPRNAAPGLAQTIVLTTAQVPEHRIKAAGRVADVVVAGDTEVSATAAIEQLVTRGHRRILVEGGPVLLGQLSAAGLLDELCLTISPFLEGGHTAARVLAGHGPAQLTGLTLASLLEDDGFLLSRYVRASPR
ncbi:MAG TPA: pyrimidine reductase family protein [Streptosporangiaceae bacterium]